LVELHRVSDRRGERVERRELVVLKQDLTLQESLFGDVADVDKNDLALVEPEVHAPDFDRDDASVFRLELQIVVGESGLVTKPLGVFERTIPALASVEVFYTAIEKLRAAERGEKLGGFVCLETRARRIVEQKRCHRRSVERRPKVPA
jgi:hypothetical protein